MIIKFKIQINLSAECGKFFRNNKLRLTETYCFGLIKSEHQTYMIIWNVSRMNVILKKLVSFGSAAIINTNKNVNLFETLNLRKFFTDCLEK